MKIKYSIIVNGFWLLAALSCKEPEPFQEAWLDERMSGGDATTFDASTGAYGNSIEGLTFQDEHIHGLGDEMFEAGFVPGPAPVYPGLGPVYNQVSCVSCHPHEGRGKAPDEGSDYESMFFKISMPGKDAHGAPVAVPGFGLQIQDRAVYGTLPEAKVNITWLTKSATFKDGEEVELRYPNYEILDAYQPLPAGYLLSPRVARSNFGMGLIEAIDENSILANADPDDVNKDGISGRPNYVYDYVNYTTGKLGRLGWKASVADIKGQVARALAEDIGATTSVFPKKVAEGQEQMKWAYQPKETDIHDSILNALTFYMRTLAVPARRNVDDTEVLKGQRLFKSIGCVKCHADVHTTKIDVRFKPLSGQIIRPYSDFLLHDMGPDLADNRPEFEATGQEWRTPPLWGIGLSKRVTGHNQLLHDGRARGFKEAILWHGGEAQPVKQIFTNLRAADRQAIIRFLESL